MARWGCAREFDAEEKVNQDVKSGDQQTNPLSEDVAAVYYSLVTVRNQELATHWSRFNVLALLNVGLMAAILTRPLKCWQSAALCMLGAVLAMIWLRITRDGKRMLTCRWERYIIDFEQRLSPDSRIPKMFTEIALLEGRIKKEGDRPTEEQSVRLGLQGYLPVFFIGMWVILMVLAAFGQLT